MAFTEGFSGLSASACTSGRARQPLVSAGALLRLLVLLHIAAGTCHAALLARYAMPKSRTAYCAPCLFLQNITLAVIPVERNGKRGLL